MLAYIDNTNNTYRMDTLAVDILLRFLDISVLDIDEGKTTQRMYRSRQKSGRMVQQRLNVWFHQIQVLGKHQAAGPL